MNKLFDSQWEEFKVTWSIATTWWENISMTRCSWNLHNPRTRSEAARRLVSTSKNIQHAGYPFQLEVWHNTAIKLLQIKILPCTWALNVSSDIFFWIVLKNFFIFLWNWKKCNLIKDVVSRQVYFLGKVNSTKLQVTVRKLIPWTHDIFWTGTFLWRL